MSNTNANQRANLLAKMHKVLKKHYKPVEPPADRSVLEHLVYAACLENASFELADESLAKLQQRFFDWNEVRVTTVTELAESLAPIPDAMGAAQRVKKMLHSVFEAQYSFDLEGLKKLGLGKAIEELEKFPGVTQFAVDYLTQNALGGHAIAMGKGALDIMYATGAMTDADAMKLRVPGLERTIDKKKGSEFFSLLHQLGADLTASPSSTRIKSMIYEIEPEAKDRMGKRPIPAPVKEPEQKVHPHSKPLPDTKPTAPGAAKAGAPGSPTSSAAKSEAPTPPKGEAPKKGKGAEKEVAATKESGTKAPVAKDSKEAKSHKAPVDAKPVDSKKKAPPGEKEKGSDKKADAGKAAAKPAPKPAPSKTADAKKEPGKGIVRKKPK
jgi:endonuclease III